MLSVRKSRWSLRFSFCHRTSQYFESTPQNSIAFIALWCCKGVTLTNDFTGYAILRGKCLAFVWDESCWTAWGASSRRFRRSCCNATYPSSSNPFVRKQNKTCKLLQARNTWNLLNTFNCGKKDWKRFWGCWESYFGWLGIWVFCST